ncbi:hypothetical protein DL768_007828 [Monosporascus sp. mg162]|nr:hypothetical protein DL768_007828 [Monosporascus sp. mg162]
MAIIKEVPGLKAQIVDTNGAPLTEYDDPYAEGSDEELQLLATATKECSNVSVDAQKIPHVVKYIEAISGAEFGFEFTKFPNFEHHSHHLAFALNISNADMYKVKHLGTLRILVHNMMFSSKTYTPATTTLPNTGPVHEKALKGRTVTHKVDFAPGKPGIPTTQRQVDVYQDPLKRPFAVFEFRYRSREGLIAEGIIPRPTPMDDMDEQQLRQFALQLYREKEDRDMSSKREVKSEVKREIKPERETQGGVKRSREENELTPVEDNDEANNGRIPSSVLESEQQHNQSKIADLILFSAMRDDHRARGAPQAPSNGAIVGGRGPKEKFRTTAPSWSSWTPLFRISIILSLTMLFATLDSRPQLRVSQVRMADMSRRRITREGFQGFRALQISPTKPLLLGTITPKSQDEHSYLEWFRCRTAVKFQGAFGSPFWDALVIRASLEEPSIFHAMLALSSAHKRICIGVAEVESERSPDRLEQFTLREYSKAINHLLEPHFAQKDKASIRVALVACMLFICLEFMRGRYRTGNNHLQSGIKLLAGLQHDPERGDGRCNILAREFNREPIDDWLIEAFTRMNLLAAQFNQGYWMPPSPHISNYQPPPMTFESVTQARNMLDGMFKDVFHLMRCCRRESLFEVPGDSRSGQGLLDVQRRIKSDLEVWFNTYKASRVNFQVQLDAVSKIGYQLLLLYYIMASILADTCLRPEDEMAFDSHCHGFVSMITHSVSILEAVRAVHDLNDPVFSRSSSELSLFTADIGWTPPLYFTALHCRIHPIRRRTIQLLRALPSREGIWDSIFAAFVAEEVMRIEEGDYYNDVPVDNYGPFDSQPHDHALSLPTLPASRRVYDVQVILPDSPSEKTVLTCKRNKSDGGYEVITKEYNTGPQANITKKQCTETDVLSMSLDG